MEGERQTRRKHNNAVLKVATGEIIEEMGGVCAECRPILSENNITQVTNIYAKQQQQGLQRSE